ncbi:MAG TPA: hypothetical protein VNW92_29205, partial [Polyangiaceae bacterium]|nr:hypothetical protein [Polyangiaceae bacterium]
MNSSLGFSFRRAAFAAVSLGLVAGACLDASPKRFTTAATCTVTAECATASECSAGVCVPAPTPTSAGGDG